MQEPLLMVNNNTKSVRQNSRLKQVFWAAEIALFINIIIHLSLYSFNMNAIMLILSMVLLLPTYIFANKGEFQKGSTVLLCVLTAIVYYFIWINYGLRDEGVFAIAAIICFAATLGQKRLLFILFAIAIFNFLAIGIANQLGWVTHESGSNNVNTAIILITILCLMTFAVTKFVDDLSDANKRLAEHKATLESTVKARTEELEMSFIKLTETKKQLVENEKMASLGKMVAGVAHEINTPVGISITASSFGFEKVRQLERAAAEQTITKSQLHNCIEETKNSFDMIQSNLNRAVDLINDFKMAAVEQTESHQSTFFLNDCMREIVKSLTPRINENNVTVVQHYDSDITIKTSKGALAQIITNFVINSLIHGLKGVANPTISITASTEGEHVVIVYTDNGKGMSQQVLSQIFEPFYTTKRGKGSSGLGMHIVYNLVNHTLNGSIQCESVENEGVCFTLKLPK